MNDNPLVCVVLSWVFLLALVTMGKPDILDGLIRLASQGCGS